MNKKQSKNIVIKIIFIFILFLLNFNLNKAMATTKIPQIYFEGNIENMNEKSDEREIEVEFKSSKTNFEADAKIKIQGTSSLGYAKKNYNITFYEDDNYEKKQKIDVGQGWGAQSKYCLKANWIDKTHSRNIVSARITAKIQKKYELLKNTPNNGLIDGFPVEIYINNEFLGLYTWNIPKDNWLWNLDEDNSNHIALAGDDWTDEVAFKKEITEIEESKWEIEIGEESQETIDKFNRIINFVNTSSDEEFKRDFEQYLNKDATLNYIIMLYAMEGSDNYGKNMIMLTYDGQIWYPNLYDLDSTWGTWFDGSLAENYNDIPDGAESKLLTRTINCFKEELATRWFELRKNILSKKNILKEFEKFINSIPEETYKKEQEKWGEIPGYGIEQIEAFLDYRLEYIDNLMSEKLNYEKISINKYKKEIEIYISFIIGILILVFIVKYIIYKTKK